MLRNLKTDYWLFSFSTVLLLFIVSLPFIVVHSIRRDARLEKEITDGCHAQGMVAAQQTEAHGKTSVTARFCVDKQGFVHWIGATGND